MHEITVVYTYYGQREMVDKVLEELHPKCRVVVVDDCFPIPLEKIEGIDVYRIEDEIEWNIAGARNLGFHVSDGWIVNTDMDHILTRDNVEDILKLNKEKGTVYQLGRKPIRIGNKKRLLIETEHANPIILMHKDDFNKLGGYDEDFSGHYGWDDILFIMQAAKRLKLSEVRDIKLSLYEDAFCNLSRDESYNKKILEAKKDSERNTGSILRFNWHKV